MPLHLRLSEKVQAVLSIVKIKIKDLLRRILIISFIPAAFVVKLIKPFRLIRFGTLHSDRIGHFAGNIEMVLCEKDAGIQPRDSRDYFFSVKPVSNYQLLKMWKRTLNVTLLAGYCYHAMKLLPDTHSHIIRATQVDRDVYNLFEKTGPHLFFTEEEHELGMSGLNKMGINNSDKFICFIARDSAYLAAIYKQNDWSYHNYRDSSIENYLPAMEELTKREYYTLRMGAIVKKHINTQNPKIIDYSRMFRTDFMDIYLAANCHFFVASDTGFDAVPYIFRRPIVYTNCSQLQYLVTFSNMFLCILKKCYCRKEKKYMTLSEILKSGAGDFIETQQYDQAGIELIENTPDEIRGAVIEMDERLKDIWQATEEDEELQSRFWYIFGKYADPKLHGEYRARIGTLFLRQNKYLLE